MVRATLRTVSFAAVLAAGCFAAAATLPSSASAAPGGQRFRMVDIIDPNGFGKPMPALRGLVPADWQPQGGVVWNPRPQCGADGIQIRWMAGDARTGVGVELLPVMSWQANNLPMQIPTGASAHCLNAPITTARAYLEALVRVTRPGAQILDYRPQPDIVRAAGFQPSHDVSPMGELRNWAEAGDVLIGYNFQGRNFREIIRGVAVFNTTTMPGVMPGEIREFLIGNSLPAFAMRAPDGALDFKLFDTIHRSFKTDPEWAARMAEHNAIIAKTNAKGAADRHAIRMQTNAEISSMINKGWADRQASQDRTQEKFVRTIRGVELYADPAAGRPVELPNTYDHAWRLQDGTYMMTDNPNFDPNVEFGVNGTRLQVIR